MPSEALDESRFRTKNPAMGYKKLVNYFSTTRTGAFLARTISSKIDPLIYKASGGRFTSTGVPTIPQLVLKAIGRKSGVEREVQLGYTPDEGDWIVVASNFGGKKHPAWSFNLDANPDAKIVFEGETIPVRATRLNADEKAAIWPKLCRHVPQYNVYVTRTDRDIKVYRLSRARV